MEREAIIKKLKNILSTNDKEDIKYTGVCRQPRKSAHKYYRREEFKRNPGNNESRMYLNESQELSLKRSSSMHSSKQDKKVSCSLKIAKTIMYIEDRAEKSKYSKILILKLAVKIKTILPNKE